MKTKLTTKNFLLVILPLILAVLVIFFLVMSQTKENRENDKQSNVANFEECVVAGNPIMESYPRQCRHGEETFTEELEQLVGGDKDEHDCIASAGYSWCAPKNKCLRVWEEACYIDLEQEIQYLLADKYKKTVNEVQVTVNKQVGNYARGGVKFGVDSQGVGALFLVAKIDNIWQLIYDGNGSVNCLELRQVYSFPEEILKPNFCD